MLEKISASNFALLDAEDNTFGPLGHHSVLPLWDQGGGMIFVSSTRQGGQLLNFKSQDGDTFRGGDDFRQSSRGGTALS